MNMRMASLRRGATLLSLSAGSLNIADRRHRAQSGSGALAWVAKNRSAPSPDRNAEFDFHPITGKRSDFVFYPRRRASGDRPTLPGARRAFAATRPLL